MTIKKYAYLQGEDVFSVFTLDDTDDYQAGIISAIESGAKYVEVRPDNPSDQFWTWDGTVATSPVGDTWEAER